MIFSRNTPAPTMKAPQMGQLIQSTLMKKQGMSNILKTITDSVEKQREKKAKAKQNEAVAQLVGATMSPAQKQALQEQGISIDQVAKGVDNPELLLKTVGQIQAQTQLDKANQLAQRQIEISQQNAATNAVTAGANVLAQENRAAALEAEVNERNKAQEQAETNSQAYQKAFQESLNDGKLDPQKFIDVYGKAGGSDPQKALSSMASVSNSLPKSMNLKTLKIGEFTALVDQNGKVYDSYNTTGRDPAELTVAKAKRKAIEEAQQLASSGDPADLQRAHAIMVSHDIRNEWGTTMSASEIREFFNPESAVGTDVFE